MGHRSELEQGAGSTLALARGRTLAREDTPGRRPLMSSESFNPLSRDDESYRTCAECGRDCEPEPFPTEQGIRISFSCAIHGVHTVIDPFEDKR